MNKNIVLLSALAMVLGASGTPTHAQTAPLPAAASKSSSSDVYFINRAKNLARQAAISANGGLNQYRPDPIMYGPAVQTDYARNADGSITFKFTGGLPGAEAPSVETIAKVLPSGTVSLEYNGTPRTAIGGATLPSPPVVTAPVTIDVPAPPLSSSNSAIPSTANAQPSIPPITIAPAAPAMPTLLDPVASSAKSSPNASITPLSSGSIREIDAPKSIAWVDQDAFISRAQNLARQAAIRANGGLDAYRPESSMYGPSSKAPYAKNADGSLTFNFKGGAPDAQALTVESVIVVNPANSVNVQYNGPIR